MPVTRDLHVISASGARSTHPLQKRESQAQPFLTKVRTLRSADCDGAITETVYAVRTIHSPLNLSGYAIKET